MEDIINQKIEELIKIARERNEKTTEAVLLVLQGSRKSGQDQKLASKVVEYAKDVLRPEAVRMKNQRNASKN